MTFSCLLLKAQDMTSHQLLEAWKINDKTQTIAFEKTLEDLKSRFNKNKFLKISSEVNVFLQKNSNPRLEIRFVMYKIMGEIYSKELKNSKMSEILETEIKKTFVLKDEQLLSELYSFYYEQDFDNSNDKLYYITTVVNIQNKIGKQYFPKLPLRYYNLCLTYYNLKEYHNSIESGNKGLQILERPENQLDIYCFLLDLIGNNYYELKENEKGLKTYEELQTVLKAYKGNYQHYRDRFSKFDNNFVEIWEGVAMGGLARGFIYESKYNTALILLKNNVKISTKYKQYGDLAKAQNLIGQIYLLKGDSKYTISYYNAAINNAKLANSVYEINAAEKGLSDSYKIEKKFDSAYYYAIRYYENSAKITKKINNSRLLSITARIQSEKQKDIIKEAENTIKKERNTKKIGILILSIIALGCFYVYTKYHFKEKIKLQESENKRFKIEIQLKASQLEVENAMENLEQFRHKLNQNTLIIDALQKASTQKNRADEIEILINSTILTQEEWANFKKQFTKVYPDFFSTIKVNFPDLTQAEIRYLCLIKLNLNSSEIASALGISTSTLRVTWYRMRKKLKIEKEISASEFLDVFEKNK